MELTKEISYDKNLIQNNNFTLKYSGELFKNNSDEVFIVYGYDDDWKNTTEQKMNKQKDCFSVDINIQEFTKFNFCFKNSSNIWDNNNNSDYHLPILEQEHIEINSELNELLDQILNEVKAPVKQQESTQSFEETVAYFENLFDELFVNSTKTVELNETSEQITSQASEEQKNISYFEKLFDELFINSTKTVELNETSNQITSQISEDQKSISYFEKLFDELFVNSNQTTESNTNLDLVETFPEEFETSQTSSTIEEQEIKIQNSTPLALTTTKRKSIFDFENLSPLYVLGRRLRLAFYKLIYVLPAFLFGEEEDSEN